MVVNRAGWLHVGRLKRGRELQNEGSQRTALHTHPAQEFGFDNLALATVYVEHRRSAMRAKTSISATRRATAIDQEQSLVGINESGQARYNGTDEVDQWRPARSRADVKYKDEPCR